MTQIALVTRIELEVSVLAARALSDKVSHLYVAGTRKRSVDTLVGELTEKSTAVEFVDHDATDATSWKRLFDLIKERHNRLDIFINATSPNVPGDLLELDLASFRQSSRLNIVAPWLGMKGAIDVMASNGGVIVNLVPTNRDVRGYSFPLQSAEFEALKIMAAAATLDCASLERPIRVNRLCYDPDTLSTNSMMKAVQVLADETSSFMTGTDLVLSAPDMPGRV